MGEAAEDVLDGTTCKDHGEIFDDIINGEESPRTLKTHKRQHKSPPTKGRNMDAQRVAQAIEDIRPHVPAWIKLLEQHVASLPPDRFPSGYDGDEGSSERGYAEHELRAMKRDLTALLAAGSWTPIEDGIDNPQRAVEAGTEPEQTGLEYALSKWPDTRNEMITREEAAQVADAWEPEALRFPGSLSAEFLEGWAAACEAIALNLRIKDMHG